MKDHRDCCATCGSRTIAEIIDLGMHPMADTFVPADRRYEGDRLYPLICDLCVACGQIQLRAVTNAAERYNHFDYSYTSSNSNFSRTHWTRYASDVSTRAKLRKGARIVEIGANDGYLSEKFKELSFRAFGVDPSPVMCGLAAERHVETHCALFSHELAQSLVHQLGERPALIVANNVVNHANDPEDFARGVRELLAPGGLFVFELPYWLRTIREGKFDQIYHEHVSYFTVRLARSLFASVGLTVVDAEEVDYHGGSIRVFVGDTKEVAPSVDRLIEQEEVAGLFDVATYEEFMKGVRGKRNMFVRRVFELKSLGERIVCVGAAAKANTFLNYYRFDASIIDYVTDASPAKIGKYTPGTRIPIRGDDILSSYGRVYAIITSWNLADTLRNVMLSINPAIEFLNPYEDC